MSQNQNIQPRQDGGGVAPTPQNTPLDKTVLSSRPAGMGKPKVEDVEEDEEEGEDVGGMNPASLLAQVSDCHKVLMMAGRLSSSCLPLDFRLGQFLGITDALFFASGRATCLSTSPIRPLGFPTILSRG